MWTRITAYFFLLLGVAGVCLPILPGIPFLLIGMRLLGPDHPLTRPVVGWINKNRKSPEQAQSE